MKTLILILSPLLFAAVGNVCGQAVNSGSVNTAREWTLKELDGNSRTWVAPSTEPVRGANPGLPDGVGHRMVEIATGLNYLDGQQWTLSSPEFEPTEDAFVANRIQHRVRIMDNLNVIGAVRMTTPDGITLESTPVGIALFDAASGDFLVIGAITNCIGMLVSSNQVVFENAFSGVCADVVFMLDRGSFHQDVVITGRLNPVDYGFPLATTRVQILTEFYQEARPQKVRRPVYVERKEAVRNAMVSPDIVDETLTFGKLVFVRGQAYSGALPTVSAGSGASVAKEYKTVNDRTFLVESVRYGSIRKGLDELPNCGGRGSAQLKRSSAKFATAMIPKAGLAQEAKVKRVQPSPQLAQLNRRPGVVIDYTATVSGSTTLFQGDTTYLVAGTVYCNDPVTIEGGAILKYKSGAAIHFSDTLTCKTAAYRPAIFTAVDDNSVGESMNGYPNSGYTGTISGSGYANPAIAADFIAASGSYDLHHLRFRYAQKALDLPFGDGAEVKVRNSQFLNCIRGISIGSQGSGLGSGFTVAVVNTLLATVTHPITFVNDSDDSYTFLAPLNCTVNGSTDVLYRPDNYSNYDVDSTNSVFANVGSLGGTLTGYRNGFYSCTQFGSSQFASALSPFQIAVGGNHYLTADSGFRNQGSSTYVPADLRAKTTYPPIAFTNTTSIYTLLEPQAQRDTDAPDLGYHYDPLDYVFGKVDQSTNLTFTAGTAVGWFRHDSGWTHAGHGIHIADTKTVTFAGLVDSPCWFVHQTAVQEQLVGYTPIDAGPGGITGWATSKANQPFLNFRFTKFAGLPIYRNHIRDDNGALLVTANHCEFYGGGLGGYVSSLLMTNCLLDRAGTWLSGGNTAYNEFFAFRNCTVRGGYFVIDRQSGSVGQVKTTILDTAFDGVNPDTDDPHNSNGSLTHYGYNAYQSGNGTEPVDSTHDVVVTDFYWQQGSLGDFYIPDNSTLIDAGSRSAVDAGLYHFTIRKNQIKEGNELAGSGEPPEKVDIGYHYVATLPPASGAQAVYIRTDDVLQGSWKGIYGADGYNVIQNATNYPSYASVSVTGNSSYTWAGSTSDARALQKAAASDRIAACWYAGSYFTNTLNLTDGQYHRVAFYCLDWDGAQQRAQTIEIRDASTDALLDSRSVASFSNGKYLVWEIKGHVRVKFIRTGAYNTVLSGSFFATGNQVWIDADGDGVPDYQEDVNGDGSTSGDPTSWLTYDSPNGLASGSGLQVFTPLK